MSGEELQREIERHADTADALRASEDTVRALLDATTETALLVDTEGNILALNTVAYERLKRLSPKPVGDGSQQMLGLNVFDLFPPGLAEERKARNEGVIRTGIAARFEDERAGHWMDNTIYPIRDQDGAVTKLAIFSYDITDRKWAEVALQRALREAHEQPKRDPLTGTLNHTAIVEELQKFVESESSATLAVVLVGLDGLKAINSTYGHKMGDAVLVATAETLVRDNAVVGRYGGDEFVALLPNADGEHAEQYKLEISASLGAIGVHDEASDSMIPVHASVGIATSPADATDVLTLLETADRDLNAQKTERRADRPRSQAA